LEQRFTFPDMQVGSIIEYSYTVNSSWTSMLPPWRFQGHYPHLWSEYTVIVPDLFNYAVTIQSSLPFYSTGRGTQLDSDLPDILAGRHGNNAEINLLLTGMLRKEGILADPVILSTRENGLTNPSYPLVENLNYVIVRANVDGEVIYLDASTKDLGFARLPLDCYNGHARVITRQSFPVYLEPDSLLESKMTTFFLTNNEKEGQTVRCIYNAGYYGSIEIRNALATDKKEDYFKTLVSSLSIPAKLQDYSIDSLRQSDLPINLQYEAGLSLGNDDLIYFSPMMGQVIHHNLFVSGSRLYPVELPFASNETYILDMEIPKGYTIEEMPGSVKVDLNDGDGSFEYIIGKVGDRIQLRRKLIMRKTRYLPETYEGLRSFYEFIIKKENEMIVFKKGK
jgi:hypothetical protein